jgi:hypothetical protein
MSILLIKLINIRWAVKAFKLTVYREGKGGREQYK